MIYIYIHIHPSHDSLLYMSPASAAVLHTQMSVELCTTPKSESDMGSISVRPCVAVCCSLLQCVVVCCSVLQCVAVCCSVLQYIQTVAVCCSVLQHVAVCCSVSSRTFGVPFV